MVGSSVNCDAEMSADIASIPSWKLALLERKRLHDKESSCLNDSHTPSGPLTDYQAASDSAVPAWKRDILARKQNQKNSFVFLAKSGQSGDSHASDTLSSINNGHVSSLVYDSLCYSTKPEVGAADVDIDINDTAENLPVEERLLPIHQNPILRLDLKKRHQSSSGSTRSSLSPRVTCTSTGNHEHSSTASSVGTQAPVTPDPAYEEVFCNDSDGETEVAYGKGFVHKLLMKFSHLSSGNELTANNRFTKQKFVGLADGTNLLGSGSQRKMTQDLESIAFMPSSGMPTTKIHSADDLLHETKFNIHIDHSDSASELDITATAERVNGELDTRLDHHNVEETEHDILAQRNSSCSEISDELPFANIVSTARTLFESLAVHSASQKRSPSPSFQDTASSRFSYTGTLERSRQLRGKSIMKTCAQEASTPKTINQSYDDLNKSVKPTAETLLSNTADLATCGDLQKNADVRIEGDADECVQESFDGRSNGSIVSPSSPSSVFTHGSVFNRGVSSSVSSMSQPVLIHSSKNDDVHVLKSSSKEQEHEILPTALLTQSKTAAVAESRPFTVMSTNAAKPIHAESSLLPSQTSDDKEIVKSQPASCSKKPPPALRPGKLVIRPASNLVAAKTSAEYLELTKFNDVRKGEFAPPLKKERIDLHVYDDDVDRVDGVASDSVIMEEYVFAGAGVIIGRSLLTKTNKKSVNTWDLFIFCSLIFRLDLSSYE